jgi:hypothetical protein
VSKDCLGVLCDERANMTCVRGVCVSLAQPNPLGLPVRPRGACPHRRRPSEGVSLHDLVEVVRDENGSSWAVRVAQRGPFSTVRVVLNELRPRSVRLLKLLETIGCSSEGMHAAWFVVSAPDEATFARLVERLGADGLRESETRGHPRFSPGATRIAEPGSGCLMIAPVARRAYTAPQTRPRSQLSRAPGYTSWADAR